MIRKTLILLFVLCAAACSETPSDSGGNTCTYPLADAMMEISGEDANIIKEGIIEYSSLARNVIDGEVTVDIYEISEGNFVVDFTDGIPPYYLINLVGWFGFPNGASGDFQAKGTIVSPESGISYTVQPELDNEWGDSLIGISSENESIRVCLVDGSMCKLSRKIGISPISTHDLVSPVLSFVILVDLNQGFGNPGFKITHPPDTEGLGWAPEY